ncbi:MAG: arginase family protein [Blautia sp.]|nr:arginase family protein [Blautia sp.]
MQECPIIRMNFSGIYDTQTFHQDKKQIQLFDIDLRNMSGTNCYCDDEAKEQLSELVKKLPLRGIHFLDSGNFHYMTRIWLTHLDQPFRLLVFDHHTDLQPPAFGGLLSCGGWIDSAMRELPLLREVVLVGPDEAAYAQVDDIHKKKIRYLSEEAISGMDEPDWLRFFERLPMDLPWYLSIDKDILRMEDARTTWSQGKLSLDWLLSGIRAFFEKASCYQGDILGMDVCGECDPDKCEGTEVNDRTNRKLLEVLKKFYA